MKLRPTAKAARDGAVPILADSLAPSLAESLAAAIDHLRNERVDEAEPALNAILQRWPDQPDALHFKGVLLHTRGEMDEAVALIRRALALVPDLPSAWNNLGNVLQLARRPDEAAEAYEQAVHHAPTAQEGAMALNNLGLLHRKQHRLDQSEGAFRTALERAPDFADAWYNLSETLVQLGRLPEALIAHSRARVLWPAHLQPRNDVIRSLMLLGEKDKAAELLREWLAESPGDAVATHMLAACLGSESPERASDGYVEQVFDQFASSFDSKLEALDYSAPALVVAALARAAGPAAGHLAVVDAGCGTGLCGPGLKPWALHLAGCDLSTGMLQRARSRAVYDVLHKAELTHYLDTQPAAFDAVVSADTLCYFGPLQAVFAAAQRCLRGSGWLVFTVEALPEGSALPHRLQSNGRYAHDRGYLERALTEAGFRLLDVQHEKLRKEGGLPVMGWLVTAQRLQQGAV